jgi:hypothetical protein
MKSTFSFVPMALVGLLASFAPAQAATPFRIATFNTSLSPNQQNGLIQALSKTPSDPEYNTPGTLTYQARQIAEVIQRINPDIVLLNEFNYDPTNPTGAATLFQQNFLSIGQDVSGDPNVLLMPLTLTIFMSGPMALPTPLIRAFFLGMP